ncbi:MAG: transposase [Verrucomicrobia bacterium]|nr:transposase [Verrucomicrobiota bacterium]
MAHFSVSYNKWTEALERCAAALPESAWSAEQITTWRSGKKHRIQHAWLNYQPQGCERVKSFLVTRHQDAQGEMFWQYSFICCDGARQQKAATAVERHKLKGDRERLFSYVLSDMDLHHPPCQSLAANKAFYALAMLAYNLLQAIKLLHLPDKDQCVRIRTLIHILMLIPVHFKRHARQLKAVCCVASNWLPWWKGFIGQLLQAQQKLRFCSS